MSARARRGRATRRCSVALVASSFWLCPAPAGADVIRGSFGDSGVAPDEGFEEDCLGDAIADDCDLRAALMEGQLASLLSHLEDDTDPATQPLFEAALELDSPLLNDLALRYLSRAAKRPQDFLDKARSFFFGPDAPLAVSAAGVLGNSLEPTDRDLGATFAEGREASDYAPAPPLTPDEHNPLLVASIADARFDAMPSFDDEEVFLPAERLLMYDRSIRALPPPEPGYPATAYMTDASVEEVAEFFSGWFGSPLGSFEEAQANYQKLTLELAPLQTAAASGDRDALAKLQAQSAKLKQAQDMVTLGSLLQLQSIHAEHDQLWLDGSAQDFFHSPRRAVTVGHDDTLDKTVIRYINAEIGPRADAGSQGDAGAASAVDDSPGAGGASERASASDGSGCGCRFPSRPRSSGTIAVLALLGLFARRARRSRGSAARC